MQGKVLVPILVLFVAAQCVAGPIKEISVEPKHMELFRLGTKNFEKLAKEGKELPLVNDMFDAFLSEIRLTMGDLGLDPLKLPDVHKSFKYKPIIITYHGELDLTDGWAQDVSEIYRNGDVVVDYTNRVMTFNVPIELKRILFDYRYKVKVMSIGPSGGVNGVAKGVQMYFSLTIDFRTMQVKLNSFEIDDMDVDVDFTGNILFDWLINILTGLVTTIFKGLIRNIVENVVEKRLESLVELINQVLAPERLALVSSNSVSQEMFKAMLNVY